jgi:hypothetical protein
MKKALEVLTAVAPLVGMVIVGLLVWCALSRGIDGAVFGSGSAIIGGLGGYALKGFAATYRSKSRCVKLEGGGAKRHKTGH